GRTVMRSPTRSSPPSALSMWFMMSIPFAWSDDDEAAGRPGANRPERWSGGELAEVVRVELDPVVACGGRVHRLGDLGQVAEQAVAVDDLVADGLGLPA